MALPPVPVKSLSESKPSKVEVPPQPMPPVPAVKKEPVTKTAVVKEEVVGKVLTTTGGPTKSVAENVTTGKKKVGAPGGSSLANLWGKAPAKIKAASPQKAAVPEKSLPIAGTILAYIYEFLRLKYANCSVLNRFFVNLLGFRSYTFHWVDTS